MPKVLVLHPDVVELETIITKVNALNKKSGPFDALLLLGKTSGEDIQSITSFDIPTYFTDGSEISEHGRLDKVLHENITYLGEHGIFTSADGIKMGFVNGDEDYITENSARIQEIFEGSKLDILLTYQWPTVIAAERKLFNSNSNIDKFVEASEPKYHFACGSESGKFFERAPFQWKESSRVTRFISLGKFGGEDKWIYAFNLNITDTGEKPINITENPFEAAQETLKTLNQLKRANTTTNEDESRLMKRLKAIAPEDCFFCLSSPKLQAHMIISIGTHAYMTIAKGPLTTPSGSMRFYGHCLIIPIEHIPCIQPTDDIKTVVKLPLYNEILRYQASLIKLFASFGAGTVFYQINKSRNVHFHIQAFPIPTDFLLDFETHLDKSTKMNNRPRGNKRYAKMKFEKFTNSNDAKYLEIINSKKDYVQFQVFNKSIQQQTIYVSYTEENKVLDLQFGRRLLAHLLQTPKRAKWEDCQQSEANETLETETFKKNYEPFDFTRSL